MAKLKRMILGVVVVVLAFGIPVVMVGAQTETVWAAKCTEQEKKDGCVDTNILDNKQDIEDLLKLILDILLYGLGAAATVGVVIAGIMYLTARDNPQQVAKAKLRLIEISIGLVAWAMLFALLKFLIPGWNGIPK